MQITQFFHAALIVTDLQKAEHFYTNILGLAKIERSLKYPGTWYQVGNFQLHLIEDTSNATPLQNPEKWGRNPHIALAVTDLDAAKTQLVTHNCPNELPRPSRTMDEVSDASSRTVA